jgi:hypothetical protein
MDEKTVKKKFRISIINRETEQVLGAFDMIFDLPEKEYERPLFTKTLMDKRDELLRQLVKTELKELEMD